MKNLAAMFAGQPGACFRADFVSKTSDLFTGVWSSELSARRLAREPVTLYPGPQGCQTLLLSINALSLGACMALPGIALGIPKGACALGAPALGGL